MTELKTIVSSTGTVCKCKFVKNFGKGIDVYEVFLDENISKNLYIGVNLGGITGPVTKSIETAVNLAAGVYIARNCQR